MQRCERVGFKTNCTVLPKDRPLFFIREGTLTSATQLKDFWEGGAYLGLPLLVIIISLLQYLWKVGPKDRMQFENPYYVGLTELYW